MITVKNLIKNFGDFQAVKGVSFTVEPGEILGFLGPNGAGKSTTMKMITGFLSPSSGTAQIGDYDILKNPWEAKSLFGYLPESSPLYSEMTVREFLQFIATIRGIPKAQCALAIERVIDICNLDAVIDQTIDTLSKGYRQRVSLAQAVIHNPKCLILDEPTDGLDPNQKQEVRKLISSMSDQKSIILSTHILEEVEAMCTRVIIIDEGRIIADNTPEGLKKHHPHHGIIELETVETLAAQTRSNLETIPHVKKVEEKGGNLYWITPAENHDLRNEIWSFAKKEDIQVTDISLVPTPLHQVFQNLTSGSAS